MHRRKEEEEEEEVEESLFKADAVNEEDSERDRATGGGEFKANAVNYDLNARSPARGPGPALIICSPCQSRQQPENHGGIQAGGGGNIYFRPSGPLPWAQRCDEPKYSWRIAVRGRGPLPAGQQGGEKAPALYTTQPLTSPVGAPCRTALPVRE